MNELFKDVDVVGIIKPGESFFLVPEDEREGDLDYCWQYLISRDEDILRALELEMCYMLREWYEPLRFLRMVKLSEDTYEFTAWVYFKDEKKEGEASMYLQRVRTFEEEYAAQMAEEEME